MHQAHNAITMAVSPPAVHRRPDINQATYLFLPTFASFMLFLLATLSSPIITGLSIATLHSTEGSLSVGEWGWCASGVANVTWVIRLFQLLGLLGLLQLLLVSLVSLARNL
jgi:hypothetical protein